MNVRAGLGFLDRSISDKSHRSLGRIAARGDDDETTETKPFAAVQGQGGSTPILRTLPLSLWTSPGTADTPEL